MKTLKLLKIKYAVADLATEYKGDCQAFDSILNEHADEMIEAVKQGCEANKEALINFLCFNGSFDYEFQKFVDEIIQEAVCDVIAKYTDIE